MAAEPRRVLIARDPEGETVVIGPVGSQAAIGALVGMLARHGWTPGATALYKSRAEFIREQVAPVYAEAGRHRDEAHGGGACNCPAPEEVPTTVQPHSRCTWWSDPSDDFFGQCIKNAAHDREGNSEREQAHENGKGIQWHGSRWYYTPDGGS